VAKTLHYKTIRFQEGWVSLSVKIRRPFASWLLLVYVVFVCLTVVAQDDIGRKVKNRVPPVYPEIARKMGIVGTVRLQLTIAPSGNIKETKVIGGHPILVTAAVDAVKKWKFEPANAETSGTVEFKFDPNN
jgi:TonB family protein